jgi:hypothetical protein
MVEAEEIKSGEFQGKIVLLSVGIPGMGKTTFL